MMQRKIRELKQALDTLSEESALEVKDLKLEIHNLKTKISQDDSFVKESRRLLKVRVTEAMDAAEALRVMKMDRDHQLRMVRELEAQMADTSERMLEMREERRKLNAAFQKADTENKDLFEKNQEMEQRVYNLLKRVSASDSLAVVVEELKIKLKTAGKEQASVQEEVAWGWGWGVGGGGGGGGGRGEGTQ